MSEAKEESIYLPIGFQCHMLLTTSDVRLVVPTATLETGLGGPCADLGDNGIAGS